MGVDDFHVSAEIAPKELDYQKRAEKLEDLLKEVLPMAMWESCSHRLKTEADPTTHCCDWSDIVSRIQEVLGDDCQGDNGTTQAKV